MTLLLWYKALHIFFMIAWMAGIFYLPRLFVYNAESHNSEVKATLNIMQRRLWYFISPFALLTLVFGILIIVEYGLAIFKAGMWLHIKLVLVALFYVYHVYLFKIVKTFLAGKNTRSPKFYRFLNEAPVLVLLAIVILVVVRPI
ncbi:CopD family protein [Glaciecola petra]|uniref:Protoporphyrinogen IX oxidase n=1 Tax=Glaciecola petra TaxID=3075602 RepID=A0ABU2ZS84_9ALTE|nr:CopD family protein [Aestuariibacter sp. P117]MDT0595500.1 CopD family protein [Aestuariibacter sp. P117]